MSVSDVRAGQSCIHDLKRDPVARLDKPHHVLFYYLPRGALDAIADDADAPQIGDLNHKPVGIDDDTISSLGRVLLPALSHPDRANQLFVDHILLALGIHVAQTYGGMRPPVTTDPGWTRCMAGEARQGNSQRQPRRSCATQGGGSSVRSIGELFLACVSPLHGSHTAQLASDVSRRDSQAEAARGPIVVAGYRLGLRLRRPRSPDAGLHPLRWRKPRRLASSARRIAGGRRRVVDLRPEEISLWASASAATLHHYRASPFLIRPWKRNPPSFLGPTRRIIARLV